MAFVETAFTCLSILGAFGGFFIIGYVVLGASLKYLSPLPRAARPSEHNYRSASQRDPQKLASITDSPTLALSIIIPAYNERQRLPIMLKDALAYLEKHKKSALTTTSTGENKGFTVESKHGYEIIIVDDGSTDGTADVAIDAAKSLQGGKNIKVVKLEKNRGKGGAVTHGMLHASGERLLFVDADGASHFPDLKKLQDELDLIENPSGYGVVLGSRAHLVTSAAVVKRSKLRNFLMRAFHKYLALLGISSIKDTQCGFKLFTRNSAALVFPSMHVEGWIFDIEILILAVLLHFPVSEVPIRWEEIEGSKMSLIRDSIRMAVDLVIIRGNYLLGNWKIPVKTRTDKVE